MERTKNEEFIAKIKQKNNTLKTLKLKQLALKTVQTLAQIEKTIHTNSIPEQILQSLL
jgi:hypothetical protein